MKKVLLLSTIALMTSSAFAQLGNLSPAETFARLQSEYAKVKAENAALVAKNDSLKADYDKFKKNRNIFIGTTAVGTAATATTFAIAGSKNKKTKAANAQYDSLMSEIEGLKIAQSCKEVQESFNSKLTLGISMSAGTKEVSDQAAVNTYFQNELRRLGMVMVGGSFPEWPANAVSVIDVEKEDPLCKDKLTGQMMLTLMGNPGKNGTCEVNACKSVLMDLDIKGLDEAGVLALANKACSDLDKRPGGDNPVVEKTDVNELTLGVSITERNCKSESHRFMFLPEDGDNVEVAADFDVSDAEANRLDPRFFLENMGSKWTVNQIQTDAKGAEVMIREYVQTTLNKKVSVNCFKSETKLEAFQSPYTSMLAGLAVEDVVYCKIGKNKKEVFFVFDDAKETKDYAKEQGASRGICIGKLYEKDGKYCRHKNGNKLTREECVELEEAIIEAGVKLGTGYNDTGCYMEAVKRRRTRNQIIGLAATAPVWLPTTVVAGTAAAGTAVITSPVWVPAVVGYQVGKSQSE